MGTRLFKHGENEDKSLQFLNGILKVIWYLIYCTLQNFTNINYKFLEVFFEWKTWKPKRIAQRLVLPVVEGWSNTWQTNINAFNWQTKINCQKIWTNKCRKYSIQLDENTHISIVSQFTVFSRFHFSNEIHKELLFCDPLKKNIEDKQVLNND